MVFMPRKVRPVSMEVARGLILFPSDVEETGTLRQGRPEYRILRKVWYRDVVVPDGFVFDVHSLPRPLRLWQPRSPSWWGPPALHDWLLESGLKPLEEANQIYRDAMADLGVRKIHRDVAFAGVEIGRKFFPDRITQIDPDNADLIESIAGRSAVYPERRSGLRRAALRTLKAGAVGYVRGRLML